MSFVARSGTWQRFVYNRDIILGNQGDFAKQSTRLNTGQRYLTNYETLNGFRDLIEVTGKLTESTIRATNSSLASTELELAESSLNSIKEIVDKLKDDALVGANDTTSEDDRKVLGNQLRTLGESLFQVANSKIGRKFLFGGTQSDVPVITHKPGDIFASASYKQGQKDLPERQTEKIQSSVSLSDLFTTESSSAVYLGSIPGSMPLATNAEMNLLVHDGSQNINVGDISFSAGDDLNTIVSKINTAFNTAGGQGSIVQNNSGRLKFDTALITGNKKNSSAAVVISKGSSLPNSLSKLGLSVSSSMGVSSNIRETLSRLDEAYNSNDSEALRNLIVDLDQNLNRIISTKASLGDLVSKFNALTDKHSEQKMNFQIQQSDISKIPVVEAIQEVNKAQAILQATMRTSADIISQNVFDFLRI